LAGGANAVWASDVDLGDLRRLTDDLTARFAKNFFRAGTEIAVMAKNRGKLRGTLLSDAGDRAQENREPNREDALFTTRENATAKIKRAESSFFDRYGAHVVGDQSNFFSLFSVWRLWIRKS